MLYPSDLPIGGVVEVNIYNVIHVPDLLLAVFGVVVALWDVGWRLWVLAGNRASRCITGLRGGDAGHRGVCGQQTGQQHWDAWR